MTYHCRICARFVSPNFNHVSPTCPDECTGTFSHPRFVNCPNAGRELGHDRVSPVLRA